MGKIETRGLCEKNIAKKQMHALFFGGTFFHFRPIHSHFPIVSQENSTMKRKRPSRRRRCIGRRRKGSVGGGKTKSANFQRQNFSPPVQPSKRVRRKVHHKPVRVTATDVSGEQLWRPRRMQIYATWRDAFECTPPETWKGTDGAI